MPLKYSLLKDDFTSSRQKSQGLSDLTRSFWNKHLAAAVFYSVCAGGGLLETGVMFPGDKVKVEGQWYRTLSPQWPGGIGLTLCPGKRKPVTRSTPWERDIDLDLADYPLDPLQRHAVQSCQHLIFTIFDLLFTIVYPALWRGTLKFAISGVAAATAVAQY